MFIKNHFLNDIKKEFDIEIDENMEEHKKEQQ